MSTAIEGGCDDVSDFFTESEYDKTCLVSKCLRVHNVLSIQ